MEQAIDNFKWDDKLVEEFKNTFYHWEQGMPSAMEAFKQSKVKKEEPKQWEILSMKWRDAVEEWKPLVWPDCWKIHSVKRLSDGEVFTIGDIIEVRFDNDKCFQDIINHFTYTSGVDIIDVYFKNQMGTAYNISTLPIKKKLSPKEQPEPIKVDDIRGVANDEHSIYIEFSEKRPSQEKFESIKAAIERCLNSKEEDKETLERESDLWCIADILSRIWHYGGMKVETSNERVVYGLLNKLGLYPTTEDKILMRPDWGDKYLEHNKWPNDKGQSQKYYTSDELLEAQQKAFYAATETVEPKYNEGVVVGVKLPLKYPTFADYYQSLKK